MRDPVMTISWLLMAVTGVVCEGTTTGAAAAAAIALLLAATAPSATPARRMVTLRFIKFPRFDAPLRGTIVTGRLTEIGNRRKASVMQRTQLSAADAKKQR